MRFINYYRRKRFPALSGHQSWQSREVNALKALDECDLQQAESQLKEIRSLIPNPVDPKKKRKRCGVSERLQEAREVHRKVKKLAIGSPANKERLRKL
jgi:hypothetical protein